MLTSDELVAVLATSVLEIVLWEVGSTLGTGAVVEVLAGTVVEAAAAVEGDRVGSDSVELIEAAASCAQI